MRGIAVRYATGAGIFGHAWLRDALIMLAKELKSGTAITSHTKVRVFKRSYADVLGAVCRAFFRSIL